MPQNLPYILLVSSILSLYLPLSRQIFWCVLAAAVCTAFNSGIITLNGIGALAGLIGLCWLVFDKIHQPSIRILGILAITMVSIAFYAHLIPGFQNWLYFQGLTFSPLSSPYTMYFNFDKAAVGAILAYFSRSLSAAPLSFSQVKITLVVGCLCIIMLLGGGLSSHYVMVDPKLPPSFWVWAANNLLFVCVMEEVLFRGVVLKELEKLSNRFSVPFIIPLVLSSVIFGLAHYHGGISYIGLATMAGLFYGYAYRKTNRLECAILVHFLLNVVHFLFFTYPSVASIAY